MIFIPDEPADRLPSVTYVLAGIFYFVQQQQAGASQQQQHKPRRDDKTPRRHDDDDGPFLIRNNKGPPVILATGTHWAFWAICTLIRASSIYTLPGWIRSTMRSRCTSTTGDLGE
jgi:hypothetical protein